MTWHCIESGGVQLACRDLGEGPPLVLLHGFPFDSSMWNAQVGELHVAARVLVPDLRGYGRSTLAPEDSTQGITMEQYADDLAEQLNRLRIGEPIVLCGFSMGGYVALQFALNHRDRLRALVLCDTRAAADAPAAAEARLQMARDVLAAGNASPAEGMLEKLLAPATLESRPEIVARTLEMIRRATPAAIAAAQRGMAVRSDVRERLGEIDVPALLLVGQYDAISPATEMQEIASALPQGELTEIGNAGHMAPLENPADVSDAILSFLASIVEKV